jgi:hypothetical protein
VPTGGPDEGNDRHALSDLLEEIEKRPGFYVRRFNRRVTARDCPHCGQTITYTEEKMVDTSLVIDAVRFATQDAYDIAVIFSGDLDVAPALSAIRDLGKQAWIATFGDLGLSKTLLREAWSHVDLARHIESFAYPELTPPHAAPVEPPEPANPELEMLRELGRAESHFGAGGGFVGAHYFLHRWKGHAIPDAPEQRRQILQRLLDAGRVQTYAVDGKTALRTAFDDALGPPLVDGAVLEVSPRVED